MFLIINSVLNFDTRHQQSTVSELVHNLFRDESSSAMPPVMVWMLDFLESLILVSYVRPYKSVLLEYSKMVEGWIDISPCRENMAIRQQISGQGQVITSFCNQREFFKI